MPDKRTNIGRTSLFLVPIALFSRGAAFVVPLAVAMWFGVGPITDAWYWALAFPTFSLVLAGTSLGTAVTPIMADVQSKTPERLPQFLGGLLGWTTVVTLSMGFVLCLLAPLWLQHFSKFNEDTQHLATLFLWELLPFAVLTSIGTVLRVACEINQRFVGVTITPIIRSAAVITVTWLALPFADAHALSLGLVVGEFIQLLWWLWLLKGVNVHAQWSMKLDPRIREVGRDLAPILIGETLVAMNLVIDKGFAALLPEGSVSTLEYADRARVIPQTLLQSTLVMVAYAAWSNFKAAGQIQHVRNAVDRTLRWTLALAAPVLAGMFIGRFVMIKLMFERGAFQEADTIATAGALAWYLPGILPNLLGILAVKAHVIEKNLSLILWLGVLSLTFNAILDAALLKPMGINGLALATTLNMFLIPGLYLGFLYKKIDVDLSKWTIPLLIVLASTGITVAVEQVGAPMNLNDSILWLAAIPCVLLLAIGLKFTERPGTET